MKGYKFEVKKSNLGIQLLRFLLSFWIVIVHCSRIKLRHLKYMFKGFHVPTFFLLAFYFYYPLLSNRIINKIISRFQKLLIPYIIWPTLVYILHNLSLNHFAIENIKIKFPLKFLYYQILLGTPIYGLFWFLFNLIFLSLFFSIVSIIYKKNHMMLFQLLGIISIYLNISQISYNRLFNYKLRIGKNLGSLIELMPLAIIGCSLSSFNLLMNIKSFPFYVYFILFTIIFIFFKYNIFISIIGFRYPNIFLNIFISIIFVLSFGSISFGKSKLLKILVSGVCNYTGGIYYIHVIVRDYLRSNITIFNRRTYSLSSLIYIISYFICYIGYKTFKNSIFKYLFI